MNALETAFLNIADAIRNKNGSQDTYTPSQMPGAISAISGVDVANNAGAHNSIYRGKNLGTLVTQSQWDEIYAGTFDDLFIGDYWEIDNNEWRIAAFDYWYNYYGNDENIKNHHIVIVPDRLVGSNKKMEATNITTNGYNGSEMKTTNLSEAKGIIENVFGSSHILTRKEYFTTGSENGYPSGTSFVISDVDLMNEHMVYGSITMGKNNPRLTSSNTWSATRNTILSHSQLPLFRLNPSKIIALNTEGTRRMSYWLNDIVSAAAFAYGDYEGYAHAPSASLPSGVRPCFGIVGLSS